MINNKKRVTLNRRASSLLLDYQAMLPTPNKDEVKEQVINNGDTLTNEYTRQLVESALSLPSSVKISTKPANETITKLTAAATVPQQQQSDINKLIQLPSRLKSSLRTPKSASAPCSPTTGLKSVQFSKNNLEDICLFRKAQTPLAISQRNIFWANEDEEEEDSSSSSSSSSSEEETEPIKTLHYANWPTRLSDIIDKKTKVIRIEKSTIRLMTDLIVGKVLVRNIDYHKTVTIRYTFDFWETIDNVGARFHQQDDHKSNTSGSNNNNNSYDVFSFKIKLPPNATTLYFAVHYKVGTQDYWDNNDGRNYEVQIKTTTAKSTKKQHKKKTATKSIEKKEDNFIDQDHTKEDGLKARYDFSQSINLAKNNVFDINTGNSKLLHKRSNSSITNNKPKASNNNTSSISTSAANNITSIPPTTNNSIIPSSLPTIPSVSSTASVAMPIPMRRRSSSSPTGLSCHSPLTSSPTFMDLNSQSYLELVNKYCFYSTSPSRSPMSING
ncbi:unnamed protein product [Mucor hiemalis]